MYFLHISTHLIVVVSNIHRFGGKICMRSVKLGIVMMNHSSNWHTKFRWWEYNLVFVRY